MRTERFLPVAWAILMATVSCEKDPGAPEEAESITFFMYEEVYAMKKACEACGLTRADVEDIFYGNAKRLIDDVRGR